MGSDPSIIERTASVILFDGVCNLCSGTVKFIIRFDSTRSFKFASLQSAYAQELFDRNGVVNNLESLVFFDGEKLHTRSNAVLAIARKMKFPWFLFYVLILIPRPIRDTVYDFVARNRYRWFGKSDQCLIPTPELSERFVS